MSKRNVRPLPIDIVARMLVSKGHADRIRSDEHPARIAQSAHEGLVRRHKMTYQLIRCVRLSDHTSRAREESKSVSASLIINCLASGSASSLITACTAMTSIVSPCSRKRSATPDCTWKTTWPIPRTGRRCRCINERSFCCFWSTGDWSSDDPARAARFRAASSRRVVGRKPAVLAALPEADARAVAARRMSWRRVASASRCQLPIDSLTRCRRACAAGRALMSAPPE